MPYRPPHPASNQPPPLSTKKTESSFAKYNQDWVSKKGNLDRNLQLTEPHCKRVMSKEDGGKNRKAVVNCVMSGKTGENSDTQTRESETWSRFWQPPGREPREASNHHGDHQNLVWNPCGESKDGNDAARCTIMLGEFWHQLEMMNRNQRIQHMYYWPDVAFVLCLKIGSEWRMWSEYLCQGWNPKGSTTV